MTIGRNYTRTKQIKDMDKLIKQHQADIITLNRTIGIFRGILANERNIGFKYRIEDDIQNLQLIILDYKYNLNQIENYRKKFDTSTV